MVENGPNSIRPRLNPGRTQLRTIDLKLIPGDGIGVEVMLEARRVLDRLAELHGGLNFGYHELPWSCAWSLEHGAMMPADGLDILSDGEAILLEAGFRDFRLIWQRDPAMVWNIAVYVVTK